MTSSELIALIATIISLICFSVVFTILFSSYCKTSIKEVLSGKNDIQLLDETLKQKKLEKKKNPKTVKIKKYCKSILSYGFLAFLLFIFSMTLYSNITGDLTPIFDKTVLTIKTGSMSYKEETNRYLFENKLENQFNAFDMLVIKEPVEDEIGLYDVVAYMDAEGNRIIHRIVKIDSVDGVTHYYTRGDAVKYNDGTYDPFVSTFKDIVGVYTGTKVPGIGLFILFLQSYSGMATVLAVCYCVYMFNKNYNKLKEASLKRRDILVDLIKSPSDIKNIKVSYVQYICYQGYIYKFVNDEFESKIKDENFDGKDNLYIISSDENKDSKEVDVKIKDVKNNCDLEVSKEMTDEAIEKIKNKIKE